MFSPPSEGEHHTHASQDDPGRRQRAVRVPAVPAMADGPTNSATANAANVSHTTQNAAQIGGY